MTQNSTFKWTFRTSVRCWSRNSIMMWNLLIYLYICKFFCLQTSGATYYLILIWFVPYYLTFEHMVWSILPRCLYLIGALAELPTSHSELPPLIPLMVKATSVRDYEEHYKLHETFCKVIPSLARGIGKRPFKEFLNLLFEPIFYTIVSLLVLIKLVSENVSMSCVRVPQPTAHVHILYYMYTQNIIHNFWKEP
jgi:hypothetical protein